ncbi:MAG: RDD family protein [Cyanobacteria bacterium]|nr:RDD family protein [Cyanobacteriota bacterium]
MTTADDYITRVVGHMPGATPLRAQIATELRSHITERVANGQPLDDVLRHLGDPATLAESYLAEVPLIPASFWRRAAAKLVDILIVLAPILALVAVAWRAIGTVNGFAFPILVGSTAIGGPLLFGILTAIAECRTGQTIGKRLLGIRVVRESGARISAGQAIVRQLPMFLQIYWIDVLFSLATDKAQRAFEMLSKTRVVRVEPDAGR